MSPRGAGAARPLAAADLAWARRLIGRALRRHPHLADDLIGAAYLALHRAAMAYRPGPVEFYPYAQRRIRGAVQDYLRTETPGGRGKDGFKGAWMRSIVLSEFEWEQLASRGADPIEALDARQRLAEFQRRVDSLPMSERDLVIVRSRIFDRMSLRSIGRQFGITDARVSQIVLGALEALGATRGRPRI